jgi:iron complex outermembrane receptor protein
MRFHLFWKTTLCIACLFFARSIEAQSTLRGVVVDAEVEHGLWFANVALRSPKDSTVVAGATTEENGGFEIKTAPGRYLLWVSYVGYQDEWQELELKAGTRRLPPIRLGTTAQRLDEITVTAAASIFQSDFDKRVFNVENTVLADGGTAIQLLETLPSIQVDEQGGISMRGSGNILVYINGRPTNMRGDETSTFLDQFPANAIKSVELITNPSARYDAAGVGGIINIVLRESRLPGFNGQVNTSAGTGHKYTAGANANFREGIMNAEANYAYQYRQFWELSESFRGIDNPGASPFLDQDFSTTNYNNSHLLRLALDLALPQNHTVGLFSNTNYRYRDRERLYNIRSLNAAQGLDSAYVRDLSEDQSNINIELGGRYDWQIDDTGGRLQAMFSYAIDREDRIEYFDQLFLNSEMIEVDAKREFQTYERPGRDNLFVAQLDWERPLNEFARIDAGLKSTLTRNFPEQIFDDFDFANNVFMRNDLISGQFNYREDIHAAYLIWRQKIDRFSFQAGLRAELSLTESYQPEIDFTFTNNYFDFFPSVYFNYNLRDEESVQLNYSRRVNRPHFIQLAPFLNAQDLLNLRIGNPFLQPEYTHNMELAYTRGWRNFSLSATTYFRETNDAMTRVFSVFSENSVVVGWTNANTLRNLGLELVKQANFHRNIDATLTTNLFHANLSGPGEGEPFNNSTFSWSLNLLSNIRIPKIMNVQTMGSYRGPIVLAQGVIQPLFTLNIGLRRAVLNQQGTLSLTLTDVFDTRRFALETVAGNFDQRRMFNMESRILTLAFAYRFKDFKAREERLQTPSGGENNLF